MMSLDNTSPLPAPALPLRGRRMGLMCAAVDSEPARLFRGAARALGADVALIPALLDAASAGHEVEAVARLLGRLYDAVECQGMDAALVQRLAQAATIPVFASLAAAAAQAPEPGVRLQALLLQRIS